MDIDRIKALIQLVGSSPIAELELEEAGARVRIVRSPAGVAAVPQPRIEREPDADIATTPPSAPPAPDGPAADVILSPMNGVFYRRPSPDEPPFVEVGARVEKGATLALIEDMKTLNAVVAERAGIVREISPEDGAAVEEDQRLFVIGECR